jgi:hypothetical protein
VVLPLSISCGESRLLVSWCVSDRCGMTGSDEDRDRSGRPGVEVQGWSNTGRVFGVWMIERSGDAVCGLYRTQGDVKRMFLGLASKPRSTVCGTVCQWFGLKTTETICQWFGLKTTGTVSPILTLKSVAMV